MCIRDSHLAGITDVPRTSEESDEKKSNKINQVAIEGTKNVINAISKEFLRRIKWDI